MRSYESLLQELAHLNESLDFFMKKSDRHLTFIATLTDEMHAKGLSENTVFNKLVAHINDEIDIAKQRNEELRSKIN